MNRKGRVLVTGGAGYVGSYLVPKLLAAGYPVNILDLYLYGEEVLDEVRDNPNLREFRGDLRNRVANRLTTTPFGHWLKRRSAKEFPASSMPHHHPFTESKKHPVLPKNSHLNR